MMHRNAVRELVRTENISLVCLQETKMDAISDFDIMQILGAGFDYFFLPVVQTRGGILVAWKPSAWNVSNTST
jgi:exonuclease III